MVFSLAAAKKGVWRAGGWDLPLFFFFFPEALSCYLGSKGWGWGEPSYWKSNLGKGAFSDCTAHPKPGWGVLVSEPWGEAENGGPHPEGGGCPILEG